MFKLTYIYVEYENSISSWRIWNDDGTNMIYYHLYLNSQNPYETEIYNDYQHINM